MTYLVLEYFKDLKDNGYIYRAGDVFPRTGYNPSAARIAELSGTKNKRGRALIAERQEAPVTPVADEPKKNSKSRGRKKNAE